MKSVTTRLAAVTIAALVALAGCSGDSDPTTTSTSTESESTAEPTETSTADSTVLDAVEVSGEAGKKPTLTFEQPFAIEEGVFKVASAGDGDTIAEGDNVQYSMVSVSAEDGSELYSNYGDDPETLPVNSASLNADLLNVLVGQKVGVRVLIGSPAYDEESPASLAVLEVLNIVDVLEDVDANAAGIPSVEFGSDGSPTVTVPDDFKAPELVQRVVLKEGDGQAVQASDTVKLHYTGVKASDGSVFDSSWDSDPVEFPLASLIQGWSIGVPDMKVGSTIMLIIPPAYGYGSDDTSELKDETLIFVIEIQDIVAAS